MQGRSELPTECSLPPTPTASLHTSLALCPFFATGVAVGFLVVPGEGGSWAVVGQGGLPASCLCLTCQAINGHLSDRPV